MTELKIYKVYLEDNDSCFSTLIPAENEQEVAKQVEGNGEIIAIKDVSDTSRIDTDTVYDILRNGNKKVNAITEKQINLFVRVLYIWIKNNLSLTSTSLILIQNILDYAETHQLGIEDLYDLLSGVLMPEEIDRLRMEE